MRKPILLISLMLIASMLMIACGAEETGTPFPATDVVPTEDDLMTEVVETDEPMTTEEPMMTETAEVTAEPTGEGIPVTGAENPFLLENQLDYDVWNGENDQIGEVEDMIIDLANSRVSYIHIETGGFLDIGDEDSLVPWNGLSLAINEDPDVLSAADNVFILQFDQNLLEDAPDFDPNALPAVGEPAEDWDAGFSDYWGNAGVNIEPMDGAQSNDVQGVIMATDLLDSNVLFDQDADLTDTGLEADDEMNIDNAIVDTSTGQVRYVVVNAPFDDGARLIPMPLSQFRWDGDNQGFVFTGETSMLQNAPYYTEDEQDAFGEGWEDEYDAFWQ